SVFEEERDDRFLLGARSLRAAGARAHLREAERRRALLPVARVDRRSPLEERAHGFGAASAHGAVERHGARLLDVVDLRPGVEEERDHRALRSPALAGPGPRVTG